MSRRTRRFGLLVAMNVAGLIAAGSAFASLSPSFSATTGSTATTISYSQAPGDDPAALVTFYVGAGYAALLAQPEGEVVGAATVKVVAADQGGATLALTGAVKAAASTTTVAYGGQTSALSTLAAACTGSAAHSAFWVIDLSGSGQTLQVPVYVDDVPLGTPLADIANNTIKFCLPPPDVPAGTPGRAAAGAKLVSATLDISEVFSAAPAWYLWHATVTPYTPTTGKVNAAGAVEVQSIDRTPQEITLVARAVKGKSKTAVVAGRVVTGGKGAAGAAVQILIGKKVVAKATTKAGGAYSARIALPTASARLTATATGAARSAATCTAAFPPVPCSNSSYSAFTATSAAVRVKT